MKKYIIKSYVTQFSRHILLRRNVVSLQKAQSGKIKIIKYFFQAQTFFFLNGPIHLEIAASLSLFSSF